MSQSHTLRSCNFSCIINVIVRKLGNTQFFLNPTRLSTTKLPGNGLVRIFALSQYSVFPSFAPFYIFLLSPLSHRQRGTPRIANPPTTRKRPFHPVFRSGYVDHPIYPVFPVCYAAPSLLRFCFAVTTALYLFRLFQKSQCLQNTTVRSQTFPKCLKIF